MKERTLFFAMREQRRRYCRWHGSICFIAAQATYASIFAKAFSPSKFNRPMHLAESQAHCLLQLCLLRRKYQASPQLLMMNDSSDPFYDEADELLTFMDMLEDDKNKGGFDYVVRSGNNEIRQIETSAVNAITTDHNEQESNEEILQPKINGEEKTSSRKETDEEPIDNLIVPDLGTLLSNMQLAPASEIAYFYLQNTIGLEPEVMWKITNTDGSVLGFTVQNLENKINLWRRMMNVSDEDVRMIITKQPSILHMSANRNISPTMLFLIRALDLSKDDLRQIVCAYPCTLCYSIENLARKLNFFERDLGMGKNDVRKLLLSEPKLITASVDTGLMPRYNFLHKELKIRVFDLQKIVKGNPRILLYSLVGNLHPKIISFFIMKLYMEPQHVLKLLSAYPLILDYNLEDHMIPIARYLISELEFSPMEMRRILLKFPRLMTHSLFKIKHVVGYLRFQLGMDANEVKRVLFQAPQVISLSTDSTLVSKVSFLRDFFDLNNEKDLRKVIAGMPTLLLCSIENNLAPKAKYLLDQFGGDRFELRQAILTLPTLMGYSLDKRIRPRMTRISEKGVEPIKITVGITMTQDNFEKWLGNKSSRIRNGGLLIDSCDNQERSSVGIKGTAIIDLEAQQLSGRIVHWKR